MSLNLAMYCRATKHATALTSRLTFDREQDLVQRHAAYKVGTLPLPRRSALETCSVTTRKYCIATLRDLLSSTCMPTGLGQLTNAVT